MVQISPPINAEILQEAPAPESKNIPADKRGAFSKLLEGLLRNFKSEPRGSGQEPESEGELTLPDTFPPGEEKTGSIKKAALRGVKSAGLFRGAEKLPGSPDGMAEEALSDGETGKIPPENAETGQELPVSLLVPQNSAEASLVPQEPAPEDSPQPDPRELLAKEPILSEETGRPELRQPLNPAEVSRENLKREREAGNGRESGERSRRLTAEEEAARLVRLPEKTLEETEKTDRANSRRAEGGARDKRRERGGLEVRDLRTGPAPEGFVNQGPSVAGEASGAPLGAGREVELRVELPGSSRSSAGENPPARAFEEALAGELRGGLGDDIVRQASIILKNGGEGIIRLSLKPESLGNVKIRLEMAENKIAGRIIVESNEALRAFEREIASLEQAFKDSGFNGASIEMSVSADTNGGRENGRGKGEEAGPFFSERLHLAVAGYESAGDFPVFGGNPGDPASRPVNMLV